MSRIQKIAFALFLIPTGFTLFFGIYMAQPWGDNYAYQDIGGYLVLALFLAFGVSPYIGFIFILKLFRKNFIAVAVFLLGAAVISVFGIYSYYDVAFVNPDAQGALIFIVLPVLQWLATAILVTVCFFIKWIGRSKA